MEKEARQWRQIYKALQLLEYLIKHGSERVVDDARSHISTLKMLRNFHYIDDKGKDEGVNVRNRSRELVELLSDVEKIRAERRKAKTNKSKYVGVGNDGMTGMSFSGSGGRYGGFGSDSLGGGSGSSYGNDYGGGGSYGAGGSGNGGGFSDNNNGRRGYEEYNAGDDEVPHTTTPPTLRSSNSVRNSTRKASAVAAPPAAPVEDLLGGFDDDTFSTPAPVPSLATNKALPVVSKAAVTLDDDDFADFQAAPVQSAPAPTTKPNLMEMLNSSPAPPPIMSTTTTSYGQPSAGFGNLGTGFNNNMGRGGGIGAGGHRPSPSLSSQSSPFSSPLVPQQTPSQNFFGGVGGGPMKPSTPTPAAGRPVSTQQPAVAAKPSANFDDLWSLSLGSSGATKPGGTGPAANPKSIKDLEKEKALAGLWGGTGDHPSLVNTRGGSSASRHGGFGSFGGAGGTSSSSNMGGGDDLLL